MNDAEKWICCDELEIEIQESRSLAQWIDNAENTRAIFGT